MSFPDIRENNRGFAAASFESLDFCPKLANFSKQAGK
jgi:hypothetical protein